MRILLSNDDGVFAPGLAALRAAVADLGETTVVAPDSPQSAAGHSITIRRPLTVEHVRIGGGEKFDALSVDGRPADCVRLAIRELMPHPPDLVLSGINAGANVGIHVFYSGTVAAAAEAAILGVPAVAFSAAVFDGEAEFARAAGLCRAVLDRLLEAGLRGGDLVNVNIPSLGQDRPLGVRVVQQATVETVDVYHHRRDADGRATYRLGDEYAFAPGDVEADVELLAEGFVTVTPLRVDMTDHDRLARMSRLRWELPCE